MTQFPFPEQYNKRALPPVPQSASTPKEALAATTKLTDFLTRELNGIDRGIKALRLTPTRTITASDNITINDGVLLVDATAGNVTMTLPDVVTEAGRTYTIKKTDASANTVTVLPTSPTTIDGAVSVVLTAQNQSVTVVASGTEWEVLGQANILAPSGVSGSGTAGVIPKWATSTSLTNSIIAEAAGVVTVTGGLSVTGNTTLGNATSDTITATARFASGLAWATDNTNDIGASGANRPRALYLAGLADIGGAVTIAGNLTQNSNIASVAQGTSAEGRLFIGSGTGSFGAIIVARATAGFGAGYRFSTGTNDTTGLRWQVYKSGDAESGGNVGSDYLIRAYGDTGTQIGGDVLNIQREATGAIAWDTTRAFSTGPLTAATGVFATSVTTPLVTNAGTLNLRTTGANALTLGTNTTTRLTIAASSGDVTFTGALGGISDLTATGTIQGATLIGTTRVTSPLLGTTSAVDVVFDRNSVTQLTLGSLLATFAGAAVVPTSVTTPLVTNAGTLALSATGANVITGTVNSVEGMRVAQAVNSAGNTETLLMGSVGVWGGVPTNTAAALLVDGFQNRFSPRFLIMRAGSAIGPQFALLNAGGTLAAPTATATANDLFTLTGLGYDGTAAVGGAQIVFRTREAFSATARGTLIRFNAVPPTLTGLQTFLEFRADTTAIGTIASGLATLRVIPGATAFVVRDSANTLDAATFNAAGTLLTLAGGLTMAGAFTNAAGSTTNALSNTTTGAINTTLRYDSSNRLDISISAAGAVTMDAVGASSAFAFSDAVAVTGALSTTTTITTGAPSGAAGAWRLGSLITAAVTADTTRYLEVSVGGTVYKVIIST